MATTSQLPVSTLPAQPPQTTTSGGLDYAAYQRQIEQAASKTAQVQGSVAPLQKFQPSASPSGVREFKTLAAPFAADAQERVGAMKSALMTSAETQLEATKQQAAKAGQAIRMTGEATLAGLKNLERIQGTIRTDARSSSDAFGAAAEKADEYVQAARGRVSEVLKKLDDVNTGILRDQDFSKAHAMQSAVQGVMGSMKAEERNIAQTYGTESKEFQQFTASKRVALATTQSNIQASYQQIRVQQKQAYANAVAETATKMNMFVGYQEQQHVEMLKYRDASRAEYALKAAEVDTSIEQMKMGGMENLANWLVSTPVFTVDMAPMITALSDVAEAERSKIESMTFTRRGR